MTPEVFLAGVFIGIILAAPVGPLAIICIQRALTRGGLHGFASGLGIATIDAFYAGLVASGLTLIAGLLLAYQLPLRIIAGLLLLVIGIRLFSSVVRELPLQQEGSGVYFREYVSMAALALANVLTIIYVGVFLSGSGIVIGTASLVSVIVFAAGVFCGELVWWLGVCSVLGLIRNRIGPGTLTLINRVSGSIIFIAAIIMILSVAVL